MEKIREIEEKRREEFMKKRNKQYECDLIIDKYELDKADKKKIYELPIIKEYK